MSKKDHKKGEAGSDRNHPLFELQQYHMRAVELRYEGKTFKEISGLLAMELRKGVHSDTIRKWFARGGLLAVEYMDYAKGENDHRRQMMREELKKLVGKVPAKLDAILERVDETGKPDGVALAGIRTLIEVLGITANDEKETQDILAEYFERLKKIPAPGEPAAKA